MFEKGHSENEQFLFSEAFAEKIFVGFCLNTGKRFFLEVSF